MSDGGAARPPLQKARASLAFARYALAGGFADEAGRAAYMAAFHAAHALLVARTGRAPKTHSGTRTAFARLAQTDPAVSRGQVTLLGRAYELNSSADYDQALPVTAAAASAAIAEAANFVEAIGQFLGP